MGVDKYAQSDWQLRYATKDASAFAEAVKAVAGAKVDGKALYAVGTRLAGVERLVRAVAAAEGVAVMAQLEHATGTNTIAAAPAGKAAYEGYNGHGVLTYAILEALNRPAGAPAQPVSVFGVAQHVSLQVPAMTQRKFGIRQQPRFRPTGDDFSLGLSQALLTNLPPPIPTQPTHVNPKALQVFKDAGGKGDAVLQLQPFTPVTLLKSERGWAQIARDGKALGYVWERGLQKLAH